MADRRHGGGGARRSFHGDGGTVGRSRFARRSARGKGAHLAAAPERRPLGGRLRVGATIAVAAVLIGCCYGVPATSEVTSQADLPRADVRASLPDWVDAQAAQALLAASGDPMVDDILLDAEDLGAIDIDVGNKLLKLAASDPAARPFVSGFLEAFPSDATEPLSRDDLAVGGIPLLMQWDQRWGYRPYLGGSLGTHGCCPTCLSMLYAGFTGRTDLSPADVAALAEESGLCDSENGTWGEFVAWFSDRCGLSHQDIGDLSSAQGLLDRSHVLVCNLAPGSFTEVGHYILVVGRAPDGNVEVRDPYTTAVDQRTWPLDDILRECVAVYAVGAGDDHRGV